MKGLFVHDHVFSFRGERVYSNKLPYSSWERYLADCGSLLVVARAVEADFKDARFLSSGPNVSFRFLPSISSFSSFFGLRSKVRRTIDELISSVDVVFVRLPSELGLLALRRAVVIGKPVLVEVVGCPFDALWNYGGLIARVYSLVLALRMRTAVSQAHWVSYVTEKFLQSRYPASSEAQTLVASNVILADCNFLVPPDKRSLVGKTYITLGVIGSMKNRYKGVGDAIVTLSKLERSDVILRVLGDGDSTEYERLACQLKVRDRVFFDGVRSSGAGVNEWLNSLDIYFHPSYQEGLPRAVLEAMSMCLPVVASDVGGTNEIISSDFLFPKGDTTSASILISRFINDPYLADAAASGNRDKAKRFVYSRVASHRKDFYYKFVQSAAVK